MGYPAVIDRALAKRRELLNQEQDPSRHTFVLTHGESLAVMNIAGNGIFCEIDLQRATLRTLCGMPVRVE